MWLIDSLPPTMLAFTVNPCSTHAQENLHAVRACGHYTAMRVDIKKTPQGDFNLVKFQ